MAATLRSRGARGARVAPIAAHARHGVRSCEIVAKRASRRDRGARSVAARARPRHHVRHRRTRPAARLGRGRRPPGLPAFTHRRPRATRAVREARERVHAAVLNSGFEFPQRRITANLAPAHLRKVGPGFDLAIAVRHARGERAGARPRRSSRWAVFGELSLGGEVRPVPRACWPLPRAPPGRTRRPRGPARARGRGGARRRAWRFAASTRLGERRGAARAAASAGAVEPAAGGAGRARAPPTRWTSPTCAATACRRAR